MHKVALQAMTEGVDLGFMKDQQLTSWQIVCEAQTRHPDWTVAEHVAHLREEEGREIDPIWVGRWLRNIVADTPG